MAHRTQPFFIVGCSRSGTTLLRLILGNHSRIHIPPETGFLLPLLQSLPSDRPLLPAEADQARAIITSHPRWSDLKLSATLLRDTVSSMANPGLRDVIDAVFAQTARNAGKPRWGDKTPQYIEIVPALAALYPEARFIHLMRDGRDVAISFKRAGFHERWYHGPDYDWLRAVRLADAYRSANFAERFMQIRYEDLVADLDVTVRQVCNFLGEMFEPGMLCWKQRIEEQIPDRGHRIHEALHRDPSSHDVARWTHSLNWMEVLALEAFLAPDLRHNGYPLKYAGSKWKPALRFVRSALTAVRPLLDRHWRLRIGQVL